MTDRVVVLCDHVRPDWSPNSSEKLLCINQHAPESNLRLEITNVSHWLLGSLAPVARDLLEIAAFVYYADGSVSRGTPRDVFDESWVRHFEFVTPVREPDIWQKPAVAEALVETLQYLTGDTFSFEFVERESRPEQLVFKQISEELPPCPDADCVTLFSGGMDSLAGAVALNAEGRKPLLLSHQSRPTLVRLQQQLIYPLRERSTSWDFPHLGVWISRSRTRALEYSQRSRSFLYLALGSVLAHELSLDQLVVCENGITSFNLPRLAQVVGTRATRSTHPRFIKLFKDLIDRVFDFSLRIETPFIWKTRAEVAQVLVHNRFEDLLPLTVSCTRSQQSKTHPHCGVCSQCVDRRFAIAYVGLDNAEELRTYEKDIFVEDLDEGVERAQALSTVDFAYSIRRRRSIDTFLEQYGQVYDAVDCLPVAAEDLLESVFDIHERFAAEVHDVMRHAQSESYEKLYNRELPNSCLLMLAGQMAPRRPDHVITQRAGELTQALRECPTGDAEAFEDICREILTFVFCDDLPREKALDRPSVQNETDQGYKRRDMVFRNQAVEGFWAQARLEFAAQGIVVDAKNYTKELEGDTVGDFATKYIEEYKLGRFGILIGRRVPQDVKSTAPANRRIPSAIEAQKDQWRDHKKVILLLDDGDLREMLRLKVEGKDPTELLGDRIYMLRERM